MEKSSTALKILLATLVFSILLSSATSVQAQTKAYSITVDGYIGNGTADFIIRSIDRARQENAALIIKLNASGGLYSATGRIVERMLLENGGIVVWVTPSSGRATAAGAYITLAANVAVMDNGTFVGAAQPDQGSQSSITLEQWIGDIATYRGRSSQTARSFVAGNDLISADNAKAGGVIDLVSSDITSVLSFIGISGSETSALSKNFLEIFTDAISSSELIFMLLLLGFFGILFEMASPGLGIPGIGGLICLLVFIFGISFFTVDYSGVALIAIGFVMVGYGLATRRIAIFVTGGLVAMTFGLFLIDKEPWVEVAGISLKVTFLGLVALLSLLFMRFKKSMRRPVTLSDKELIGEEVVAADDMSPRGLVHLKGKMWPAVCEGGAEKGEVLVVKKVKGNVLVVGKRRETKKPAESSETE